MDPSIKKKPEKPRMRRATGGIWECGDKHSYICDPSGTEAYKMWLRIRAVEEKRKGK